LILKGSPQWVWKRPYRTHVFSPLERPRAQEG
jgi:hypothetical protein